VAIQARCIDVIAEYGRGADDRIFHVTPSTSPPREGALLPKGGVSGTRSKEELIRRYFSQDRAWPVHVPSRNDDETKKSKDGGGV
jgi:hypothetical protein